MKTLKELTKDFDYVNSDITEDKFPQPKTLRTDYKLYNFDKYISSEDVIEKMKKDGYSPASVYELLKWKDWNKEDFVIALGSVAVIDDHRGVACLDGSGSKRSLHLGGFGIGWGRICRFLAVRNSEISISKTEDSALIPSETLTLEKAIAVCKENGLTVTKVY